MPVTPTPRSLGGRLMVGSLWAAFDGWASEAATLLVFVILARLLQPADFGLVAIAGVFTAVAANLFVYSVMQVLVQKPELEDGDCDAVFFLNLGLSAVAALLFVLAAPLVAGLFAQPELVSILRWLCLGLLFQAVVAVPLGLLTRELRFDVTAKRSLVMIISGGVIGTAMALAGYGAWALVGQAVGGNACGAVVLLLATDWRPGLRARRRHVEAVVGFGWRVVGNRMVMLIDERAPQLVIGLVLGPAATGFYNVAMRLFQILTRLFVVPINQVAMPGFAKVQHDPDGVRDLFATGVAVSGLVSAGAFAGAIVVAPVVVPIVLGAQWSPMVPILQLVLLRGLAWPIVLYGQSLLYGLGQPGRLLRVNLIDGAVNLALLGASAPFGLAAIALASSLRILGFLWPLLAVPIRRATGIGFWRQLALLAPAWASALVMALVLFGLQRLLAPALGPVAVVALQAVLGVAVYVAVSLVTNRAVIRRLLGVMASVWATRVQRRRVVSGP